MSNYDLIFKYKFEAAHRFTKSCSYSCATPHGHTWYSKAVCRSKTDRLAADEMVIEFGRVKKNWKILLDQVFDHSWLGNIEDPLLPAMFQHIPHLRLIPFPGDPTTELIASLLFHKMKLFIADAGLKNDLYVESVTIDETPTNSVVWNGPAHPPVVNELSGECLGYTGWWHSVDPLNREIKKIGTDRPVQLTIGLPEVVTPIVSCAVPPKH